MAALLNFAAEQDDDLYRVLCAADGVDTSELPRSMMHAVVPLGRQELREGVMWLYVPSAFAPATESEVRRMADGFARRVDRLRALGNGVLPLVAAYAYRTLKNRKDNG